MLTAVRLPARLWIPSGFSRKHRICGRFIKYDGFSTTAAVAPVKLQTVIAAAAQPRGKISESRKDESAQKKGFRDLALQEDLLYAVEDAGFVEPTEIQVDRCNAGSACPSTS